MIYLNTKKLLFVLYRSFIEFACIVVRTNSETAWSPWLESIQTPGATYNIRLSGLRLDCALWNIETNGVRLAHWPIQASLFQRVPSPNDCLNYLLPTERTAKLIDNQPNCTVIIVELKAILNLFYLMHLIIININDIILIEPIGCRI